MESIVDGMTLPIHVKSKNLLYHPWLQAELDLYRDRINHTAKRADRNKVLPHGVPEHIYEQPEDFGCLNFKVCFPLIIIMPANKSS
jgi:hypothetical protein